jgi:hypothetical protein
VHGDNLSGFNKAGFTLGGFVRKDISDKLGVKFEIIYIQKGSRKNADPDKGDYNTYLLRLNYAEVPVVLRFNYKKAVIELGLSEGALVHAEEYDVSGKIPDPKPFRRTETNLITGVAYAFKSNIELNIRYTNSIMPVRKFDIPVYYASRFYNLFNKGLYNNVLSFTIQYQLGGKKNEQQ